MPVGYVQRGYAIASINYRLSRHALFPAQTEDSKAAVRWLRAHAAEYGLDPDRVAAWGPSAGGHLAAMLGTTGHTRTFDVDEYLDESSAVQAVVPHHQSELLVAALEAAGMPVNFCLVPDAGHGGFTDSQVDELTEAFLTKYLKRATT